MNRFVHTPQSFRKYQRNAEKLRKYLQVGMFLPAKILSNPMPGLFLILVEKEKILANSNISFSNNNIIVEVKAKKPKLLLKLIPFYGERHLEKLINLSIEYQIPLDRNNQQLIGYIISNKLDFIASKYTSIAKIIFDIAKLFDNYLIISKEELFELYRLGTNKLNLLFELISNTRFLSEDTNSDGNYIESLLAETNKILRNTSLAMQKIDSAGTGIFFFKKKDGNVSKYQFVIETELYGKLNIFCYFEENLLSMKFFSTTNFTKEFIDAHLPEIREIIHNFDYELILANLEIINPISFDKGIFVEL